MDAFIGPDTSNALIARVRTFRDITDGLSNTAFFSEKVKGIGAKSTTQADSLSPSASYYSVAQPTPSNTPDPYYTQCKSLNTQTAALMPGTTQGFDGNGRYWHLDYSTYTRYTHVMPPNTWTCGWGSGGGEVMAGAFTASSRHSGVVNVLMGDGSVRAIKSTITMTVWWALGTMGNGEVISADSF